MNFKDSILFYSLLSVEAILIPLYIVFLISISYFSLMGLNFVLIKFPSIGFAQFEIEIIHIVLFSILLAVILRPSEKMDKVTETWITSNLNIHFTKLDQINEKLEFLYDIKTQGEIIEMTVDEIRDQGR